MPVDEIIRKAKASFAYLNQGEVWIPRDGKPRRIADMDPPWRHNASQWLLRRAAVLEFRYSLGEIDYWFTPRVPAIVDPLGQPHEELVSLAPTGDMALADFDAELERESDRRADDPEGWLKATALYQALVADLPEGVERLAKHWSTCEVRTGGECTCRRWHFAVCPKWDDVEADVVCTCPDLSPDGEF